MYLAGYTKDYLDKVIQKAGKGPWANVEGVLFYCDESGNLKFIEHCGNDSCVYTSDDPWCYRKSFPNLIQSVTDIGPGHEQGLEHLRVEIDILDTSPQPLGVCKKGVQSCGRTLYSQGLSWISKNSILK